MISVRTLLISVFLFMVALAGCASEPVPRSSLPLAEQTVPIAVPQERKLVAILGFENKSSYSSDKLWDTSARLLYTSLLEAGYFRVVEWEKMKQLFDWDALATASLVKSPEKRGDARKILLCEYFLSGAVTFFDVRQTSQVSALSKRKNFETTIRIDLLLQDAASGEYIGAATGEATEQQSFSGGLSGGQTGSWDPHSADRALDRAIHQALYRLTLNHARISARGP